MFHFSLLILYDTCSLSHYNLSQFGMQTVDSMATLTVTAGLIAKLMTPTPTPA